MPSRITRLVMTALVASVTVTAAANRMHAADRPNVIFILADDKYSS